MSIEVTIDNFNELLPEITESIKSSTFVAIDCELTGLVHSEHEKPSLFDTVEQRYAKQSISASKVMLVQIGLSTFERLDKNRYNVKSYAFYLCPRSWAGDRSQFFFIEQDAIEFLADHGFDFNKFGLKGIPYLNEADEKELREKLEVTQLFEDSEERGEDLDIRRDLTNRISNRLKDKENSKKRGIGAEQVMLPFKPRVNKFKTYALLRYLRQQFDNLYIRNVNGHLLVKRLGNNNVEQELANRSYKDDRAQAIEYLVGFSQVFKQLVLSKKPLVGHNMMLDLLIIYHKFYKPLPKSLKGYKQSLNSLFPQIYDTKHIFMRSKKEFPELRHLFDISSLFHLYESLNSDAYKQFFKHFMPELQVGDLTVGGNNDPWTVQVNSKGAQDKSVESRPHDAGFDSFATGSVFLNLGHGLLMKDKQVGIAPPSWIEHLECLNPYLNKINMIQASVHCLEVSAEEKTTRPGWLIAVACTGVISLDHLRASLDGLGTNEIKVLDRERALIACGSYVTQREILQHFKSSIDYKIEPYKPFKHNRQLRVGMWIGLSALLLTTAFGVRKMI